MDVVTITDTWGDTLQVSAYSGAQTVYLDAEVGDEATEIALDVRGAKRLRKALKHAIQEATA